MWDVRRDNLGGAERKTTFSSLFKCSQKSRSESDNASVFQIAEVSGPVLGSASFLTGSLDSL